jgi:hypothetical protein
VRDQVLEVLREPGAMSDQPVAGPSAESASFESLRTALSEVEGRNLRMIEQS